MPKFVSTYSNLYAYNGLKRSLRGNSAFQKQSFPLPCPYMRRRRFGALMVLTKFLINYGVRVR